MWPDGPVRNVVPATCRSGCHVASHWKADAIARKQSAAGLRWGRTDLYTGELASRLGGADVSWIVGLSLTSLVYYAGCKLFSPPLQRVA